MQDNIEFNYQYDYIPNLSYELETIGKIYKKNNYDFTIYYGKQHFDSKYSINLYNTPTFNTGTSLGMQIYGYDKFNVFGDTYYESKHGLMSDNQLISYELPPNSIDYDYYNPINNTKYTGVIPFLKSRLIDNKSYYLECHITNPHDTNHFIQNLEQIPNNVMNQFSNPFFFEQIKEYNLSNPYYLNERNPYAVPTHPNLLKNYFENDYYSYKKNKYSLPFLNSYELDYALSPKVNSYNPLMIGTYYGLKFNMTMPESETDIKNWKNFLNNYYGLVYEADSYLEKLYYFFESNHIFETTNIIIIADHGDLLSSHGLKQKQMPFKECSNVPCLISSPNLLDSLRGHTSDIYGSLVDILPTQLVLNNLESNNSFDGKSLLVWENNYLNINYEEHTYYNPVNIVNSTMYSLNYFFYLQWYYKNYSNQILSSNPSNYFEFESSFTSIITTINGTKYKFGRYYSIYSIITYYLFINHCKNIFKLDELIEYVKNQSLFSKIEIIKYFLSNFTKIFTFQSGLEILNSDFGGIDNFYLYYVYYSFISNKLNYITNFNYLIPGSLSSWETNQQLNIFSYFLYDLDTDNSECFNLMDITNINQIDISLKNQLNDVLNYQLEKNNSINFITILAENTYIKLANLIYISGGFINKFTNFITLDILGTLNGTSSLDGQIRPSVIEYFNNIIINKVNTLNSSNTNNTYYLYNQTNNLCWMGEFDNLNYVLNNLPYFKNCVILQESPIPIKNIIQNNLIPYIRLIV
jgi:arylsulfatase A-like enzyme